MEILDVCQALERMAPPMFGLGFKEGSKRWKQLHRYLSDRVTAGKLVSILDTIRKGKYGKLTKAAMKEYKYFRRNKDNI